MTAVLAITAVAVVIVGVSVMIICIGTSNWDDEGRDDEVDKDRGDKNDR